MPNKKRTTYTTVRNQFTSKINAYRTLLSQTTGGSSQYRPTPMQLNTFSKWVDKGWTVQNVTCTQINRLTGCSNKNWTPTSAKNKLSSKLGRNTIKAVAYNKGGGFIIATPPNFNLRSRSYSYLYSR